MSRKQPFEGKAMSSFNLLSLPYLDVKHEILDLILAVTF